MSYSDIEESVELSQPVELYTFSYAGNTFAYTNDTEDITLDGVEYAAIPIHRGETEQNGDAEKANMEITVSRDSEIGELFKTAPPSEPMTVTVHQYHRLMQGNKIVIWKGRVVALSWKGSELIMTSENVFASLLRIGVTRKFSRQCTHSLYSGQCRANREEHVIRTTAATIIKNTFRVPVTLPEGYYAGGYAVWRNANTGVTERRPITENTETTVTIVGFPSGLLVDVVEITMYAGCDHTMNTCKDKFNNLVNYGGQPFIPLNNPFNGSTIY